MGINKTARDDFNAIFAAFKTANTPNRAQRRKYVAAVCDAANEWLAKFDAQDAAAAQGFAATKQAQFNNYEDALPDVTLDPVDPTT